MHTLDQLINETHSFVRVEQRSDRRCSHGKDLHRSTAACLLFPVGLGRQSRWFQGRWVSFCAAADLLCMLLYGVRISEIQVM
jgi:hypothetical protein